MTTTTTTITPSITTVSTVTTTKPIISSTTGSTVTQCRSDVVICKNNGLCLVLNDNSVICICKHGFAGG